MSNTKTDLKKILDCEIDTSNKALDYHSHDASMFELRPQVVIRPKNSTDIKKIVRYVAENKANDPGLSLTVRSAGTDMSGGAIGQSIVLSMSENFNQIISVDENRAIAQPGVFYRDFEAETLKHNALMPSFPASRDICTVGGMVSNNAGGEKSLEFGKTENFVQELKVIFADGNEYTVKPLNKKHLKQKIAQKDYEGELYKQVFNLVENNYDQIKAAKPKVSKDSTGYHLWNVWDREREIFDLNKIIVGSQGTLGIITEINFRLVANPKESGSLVIFLNHLDNLGEVVNKVLDFKPATFEGFDNYTLMLSFKLFFMFHKTLGWSETIKLAFLLIPSLLNFRRGIPKMVLIAEFTGETDQEVADKVRELHQALTPFGHDALFEEDENEQKEKKFQIMRRQSFNLLRQKVHDKHTAPFIDDLVVPPEHLPEFLPQLRTIINKHKLLATVAGHMGDGNFHVIPLMKFEEPQERDEIEPAMREVNQLVLKYGGSLSGEHNDGMSRGPWLSQQYSPEIMEHFRKLKNIFDPDNIFNPHKKTDADWDFSMSHLRQHF